MSPVANAVAIPVVGLVVVPLTLVGMVLPFDWVLQLAHQVMAWCMLLLEWLSSLDVAVWEQRAPPAWAVVAAMCGALLLLAPRGTPGRWLGLRGPAAVVRGCAGRAPAGRIAGHGARRGAGHRGGRAHGTTTRCSTTPVPRSVRRRTAAIA